MRHYQVAQQRVKQLFEEQRRGEPEDLPPTNVTLTKQALEFSRQQRRDMCALYYASVPIEEIAAKFRTTVKTVRQVVKLALSTATFCLWCAIEAAPNGIELIDSLPFDMFV
jgi:DNA-directed RNA polymerase specialized sigma24 family protein